MMTCIIICQSNEKDDYKIYRKSDICDLLFDNQNNQKKMIEF